VRVVRNPLIDIVPDVAHGLRLKVAAFGSAVNCTPLQSSLLELFASPADLDEVCAKQPRARSARSFLDQCVAEHLLLAVDDADRAVLPDAVRPDHTFLGAPSLAAAATLETDLTFAFIGIPWDRDVSGRAGARFGPSAVRAASAAWAFGLDPLTRRPVGFFDAACQEHILDGVAFADVGDVLSLPGDAADVVRARMSSLVQRVVETGAIPLVVGGDHSITRPVLSGVIDALRANDNHDPICIVHFDAHTDLGDASADSQGRLSLHHGNVMSVILEECSRVQSIVQIGLRGLSRGAPDDTDRVTAFGMDQLDDVDAILEAIPEDAACWFSIDIDVVDPAFAPSTGTPVTGGLMPRELWKLIDRIAGQRVCLGMDVVEVAEPISPHDGTATIAATCLMRFCRAMVEAERAAGEDDDLATADE
jgi:agmatinase